MLPWLTTRMRALVHLPFFHRGETLGAWGALSWWERRRIAFNFLVGTAGIVTGCVCLLTLWIVEEVEGRPFVWPDPPMLWFLLVIAYAVMANVCYTGGWLVEMLVRWLWREDGTKFASISFALGLAFSVMLTLMIGVMFPGWVLTAVLISP